MHCLYSNWNGDEARLTKIYILTVGPAVRMDLPEVAGEAGLWKNARCTDVFHWDITIVLRRFQT